ncbi:DUF3826 domain-containing protein [Zunongwangia sp. HRR-M8]|uniref:DUF3826 domain-containing protein n=1 Tax=Zunongwangia sp. HRR-M8 TaxID=3015170 RepID=UPI0022DD5B6A|nr:DUF3826 domain-containing protein [Zunongwangia sp. HRR-M8]WBL23389.1 DUF3826 domain-containing protein [Zunongwangia sp. HRR-M8]
MKKILFLVLSMLSISTTISQENLDPEYIKVTNERAEKIVANISIENEAEKLQVKNTIANQYRSLSQIHEERDSEIEEIKKKLPKDKYPEKYELKAQEIRDNSDKKIAKLHRSFLRDLSKYLDEKQIEQVKDGMTYGVVPKTYRAFQEMLPELAEEEKEFVLKNLKEAREKAMDAGSSHKKHWWFGKYKGKINNYLSSRGYDLAKAGEDWKKRIEESEKKLAEREPPHPPRLPEEVIPAFPGAWGAGMFTSGGRGGKVIAVTNLKDSGPGSLREALETKGARIVIFRVAGTIKIDGDLNINNPDITVAGQSAPGDGICIAGTLNINTHNVILRHLRVRRGIASGGQGDDNIGGNPSHHIIIDHCSTSWGMDENISLYRHMRPSYDGKTQIKDPSKHITIQWTISSEALNAKGHAFGGTWGGNPSTFHHNLFASNTARNPSIGMSGSFDFRYNVVFNWGHRSIDGGDETSTINLINNYFKPGPATEDNIRSIFARIEERHMYSPGSAWAEGDWYKESPDRPGKWYVAGNIMYDNPKVTNNNWEGMRGQSANMENLQELKTLARVNTPFVGWPVAPHESADAAFNGVLEKVGATLPKRDAVDQRVVEMVRTGQTPTETGIIDDVEEVGGYPKLTFDKNKVLKDTDKDGMPDEWEIKFGLDPQNPNDAKEDTDGDGYTNIEEYLNGTNPTEKIDYRNLGNNVDTKS